MAAIVLPIAMAFTINAEDKRRRFLYGLATCIMLAAGVSTFRKSSLLLPVLVVAFLGYYRRRQLLRLLPLVPVVFVAVHLFAPGAIGGVTEQLSGQRLKNADTTVSRTTGYESVRPYVWTNPAFGQGYGTYNSSVVYILDSQILDQLITTGVVGLIAYLGMMVTTFATARPVFRTRGSPHSTLMLGLGVSAIVFFASSFLYDAMGFPHVPYIFLTFAGFVSVLATEHEATRKASGDPPAAALATA